MHMSLILSMNGLDQIQNNKRWIRHGIKDPTPSYGSTANQQSLHGIYVVMCSSAIFRCHFHTAYICVLSTVYLYRYVPPFHSLRHEAVLLSSCVSEASL